MHINKDSKIECIAVSTIASLSFDDLAPSDKALVIGRKYLNGEITASEAVDLIKKLHKK